MALLFLLPILVCGFIYLKINKNHRYSLSKKDSQQIYFQSAFYGFIFTLIGFICYIFLNNFQIFNEFLLKVKDLIFYSLYSIHIKEIQLNSSDIKSIEQYKGLMTLSFYTMLIWTTLFSIITIYLVNFLSFIFRVFWEWSIQWVKFILIKILATSVTLFKSIFYLSYLVFIAFLNLVLSKKNVFKITANQRDKRKIENQNNGFKTQKINSLSTIWNNWSHGLISISKEIKDPLNQLLYTSIESHQHIKTDVIEKPLMITMEDRKVYIGLVIGFGFKNDEYSIENETFRFLPFKSGYRDKDTLKVVACTDYSQTINDLQTLNAIELILKKENIVSLTQFNAQRFNDFQDFDTPQ